MLVEINLTKSLAMKCVTRSVALIIFTIVLVYVIPGVGSSLIAQEVPAPPSLGENTRGEPTEIIDTVEVPEKSTTNETVVTEEVDPIETSYRREGHRYEVKVSPRVGADQYIVDENKDGKIQRVEEGLDTSNANIPKWKIGSF